MEPFWITLYSKQDCMICEDVQYRIERVAAQFPIILEKIDIRTDPALYEKYKVAVPVVHIDGEEVFVTKMAELWLRRELKKRLDERE